MARILIVDDRENVCETYKTYLEGRGHVVHTTQTVENGIDLLERSLSDKKYYEVAIIDLQFDNYSGDDRRTAGLHVLRCAVKVPYLEPIIMTAYPGRQTATDALALGASRYISKVSATDEGKDALEILGDTVELAADNRQVMMTLSDCLLELNKDIELIRALGRQDSNIVDRAEFFLRTAEKAYHIIRKSHGRHPEGQVVDDFVAEEAEHE